MPKMTRPSDNTMDAIVGCILVLVNSLLSKRMTSVPRRIIVFLQKPVKLLAASQGKGNGTNRLPYTSTEWLVSDAVSSMRCDVMLLFRWIGD